MVVSAAEYGVVGNGPHIHAQLTNTMRHTDRVEIS